MVEQFVPVERTIDGFYLGSIRFVFCKETSKWVFSSVYLLHGETYVSFAEVRQMAKAILPNL
jgi:hypothetical protein